MKNKIYLVAVLILITTSLSISTTAQSGGGFEVTQTVVANGGGTSSDGSGIFTMESTVGQSSAETENFVAMFFSMRTGFWTPEQFAPTAADATIGGRVSFADGRGLSGAVVTLTGGQIVVPRIVTTNHFGYFNFDNVEVGHFYILSVQHGRYAFSQKTFGLNLTEDIKGLTFVAD